MQSMHSSVKLGTQLLQGSYSTGFPSKIENSNISNVDVVVCTNTEE